MINTIETIGLRVDYMSPKTYSTDVDVNSIIEVKFNSELDTKSIVGNFIVLRDTNRKLFGKPTEINVEEFEQVKGSLSYKDRSIIFKPIGQLESSSRYIIYVRKDGLKDFKGRVLIQNEILYFDTTGYSSYIPCNILLPINNSTIHKIDVISLDDINAEKYIVQISKNKDFENAVYDEVVDGPIVSNISLGDGSYYIRAKATNGVFGETSFFTIKSLSETLVSDEDESFTYSPIDDCEVELIEQFPQGINVHEMTNLTYMKFDGIISLDEIDFYESGLFESSLTDENKDPIEVEGAFVVSYDEINNLTYVAFIPDEL